MLPKKQVLNLNITAATGQQVINEIFRLAEERKGHYVTFTNVHMLMEARDDEGFRRVVNNAAVACADGAPVAMLMGRFHKQPQERLAGMDVMPQLLAEAERRGKSVYFYGSTDEVLAAVKAKCQALHPGLKIAGAYSPPFRPLSEAEITEVRTRINNANPDLLFVALGCPKQERWMANQQPHIGACMLGVGQAFMTFAGLAKRLPPWMRKLSLEWAYRLVQEPKLWRRYLGTNPRFMGLAARALATKTMDL